MKKRGSITVFLALMITCFFSAIFGFLEAARVAALHYDSQAATCQAADTVLASYQRSLWSDYRLLFWEGESDDFSAMESLALLQETAVENNNAALPVGTDNYYVLQLHLTDVDTTAYELATDNGGAAFLEQAALRGKEAAATAAVSKLQSWISGSDVSESSEDLTKTALSALDTLEEAAAAAEEAAKELTTTESAGALSIASTESVSLTTNPLTWVKGTSSGGALSIVYSDSVSSKSIDTSATIAKRSLNTGNLTVNSASSVSDSLLVYVYLATYFSDASKKTTEESDRALAYELEYIIAGNASDSANLTAVVRRLLLMREAANLAYLEKSAAKRQEAAAVAAVLAAVLLQPELETVFQQGILPSWAYAESLSDVRILLDGGSVSLVKTDAQWHTSLGSLSSSIYSADASSQTTGLTYTNYLQLLLAAMSDKTMAYRAMDIIEQNTGVSMDRTVSRMECSYTYEASPLFWSFVTLGNHSINGYQFSDQHSISYVN